MPTLKFCLSSIHRRFRMQSSTGRSIVAYLARCGLHFTSIPTGMRRETDPLLSLLPASLLLQRSRRFMILLARAPVLPWSLRQTAANSTKVNFSSYRAPAELLLIDHLMSQLEFTSQLRTRSTLRPISSIPPTPAANTRTPSMRA
jgi:hypothetical protein